MSKLPNKILTMAYLTVFLAAPGEVLGAVIPDPGNALSTNASRTRLTNPLFGYSSIEGIWNRVIATAYLLFSVLALIYMTWNAIRYIGSNGDPKKTQEARQGLVYSALAIILLVSSYFIIALIIGTAESLFN